MNVSERVRKTWKVPSIVKTTSGGARFVTVRDKYRVFTVEFADISRTLQGTLSAIYDAVGITEPLVFSLDPDSYPEEDTIYCMFANDFSAELGTLEYGTVGMALEEKVS